MASVNMEVLGRGAARPRVCPPFGDFADGLPMDFRCEVDSSAVPIHWVPDCKLQAIP